MSETLFNTASQEREKNDLLFTIMFMYIICLEWLCIIIFRANIRCWFDFTRLMTLFNEA